MLLFLGLQPVSLRKIALKCSLTPSKLHILDFRNTLYGIPVVFLPKIHYNESIQSQLTRWFSVIMFTFRRQKRSIIEKVFVRSQAAYMGKNFTQAVGALVDGVVIGKALGVDALAAFSLVWPLAVSSYLIGGVIAGGSRNLYTRMAGQGDIDGANQVFTLAVLLSAGLSVAVGIAMLLGLSPIAVVLGARGANEHLRPLVCQYLAGMTLGLPFENAAKVFSEYMGIDSDHRRTLVATAAMTAADILGDLAAITFFPGSMFALGAATALGQAVYFAVLSTHFLRPNRMLRFSLRGRAGALSRAGAILVNGAPYGVDLLSSVIAGIAINHILSATVASAYIAAFGVRRSISSLVWVFYLGAADTVWALSSIYYGEEDRKALDTLQKTAVRMGAATAAIPTILLTAFPRFIAGIFFGSGDSETLALAAEATRVLGLTVPLCLMIYIFVYYLMGTGKLRAANLFNFLLEFGAVVPGVWLMVALFGGRGVWLASPVMLSAMLVGALAYIHNWKRGDTFSEKRLLLGPEFSAAPGKELNITATTLAEVMDMSRRAGEFCLENGIDRRKANHLALCIEELGVNVVEHGFTDGAPHAIDMRILVRDGDLILRIRDDCRPFNLVEQYRVLHDEEDISRNLGIRVVFGMSSSIQYLSTMSTNNLIIRI